MPQLERAPPLTGLSATGFQGVARSSGGRHCRTSSRSPGSTSAPRRGSGERGCDLRAAVDGDVGCVGYVAGGGPDPAGRDRVWCPTPWAWLDQHHRPSATSSGPWSKVSPAETPGSPRWSPSCSRAHRPSRCGCRKPHPRKSGGMNVLVAGAAVSIRVDPCRWMSSGHHAHPLGGSGSLVDARHRGREARTLRVNEQLRLRCRRGSSPSAVSPAARTR